MGSPAQICLNKKDSTMNSWILALLVSLLYVYVSGEVDDGECAKAKSGDSQDNPVVKCNGADSAATNENICKAKKPKDGDNKITFDKMSTQKFQQLPSTVTQGKQMIDGSDIVCYYLCKTGTNVALMTNGDKEFNVNVCAELPSDSASASDTASGKSSDLASMIHAISIAIPLANIFI